MDHWSESRWGEKHEWNVSFFTEIQMIPPSANTRTLDELCAEFFEFYCDRFDWGSRCICIRLGLTEHDSETGVDRGQMSDYAKSRGEWGGGPLGVGVSVYILRGKVFWFLGGFEAVKNGLFTLHGQFAVERDIRIFALV